MSKKDDPKYEQVRGHVLKPLARRFKQYCLDEDIDYSEGIERILTSFFSDENKGNENIVERNRSNQTSKD